MKTIAIGCDVPGEILNVYIPDETALEALRQVSADAGHNIVSFVSGLIQWGETFYAPHAASRSAEAAVAWLNACTNSI